MRWIVLVLWLVGCGGPKIPAHSGYKSDKSKPWNKAKALKFSEDKGEAKSEGELNYADHRRARWYALTLPTHGELTIKVEITPPGDATNEDFDLGVEVLDPHFRVISKSDLEDGEDAGELTKTKPLFDLEPGKYLVHLYLQSRVDTADYILRATFKATKAAEAKTDYPAQVAFYPSLPMVPLNDDTPARYRPTNVVTRVRNPKPPKPQPGKPPPVAVLTARIVGVSVVGNSTRIVVGRGTTTGAASGMKAKLNGIPGVFAIDCNENTCSAVVNATPDQVRGAGGTVTLLP